MSTHWILDTKEFLATGILTPSPPSREDIFLVLVPTLKITKKVALNLSQVALIVLFLTHVFMHQAVLVVTLNLKASSHKCIEYLDL